MRGGAVRAVGLFMPMLRESAEMLYEFDEPFVVDSSDFEQTFGWAATSWDDAVVQMTAERTMAIAAPHTNSAR